MPADTKNQILNILDMLNASERNSQQQALIQQALQENPTLVTPELRGEERGPAGIGQVQTDVQIIGDAPPAVVNVGKRSNQYIVGDAAIDDNQYIVGDQLGALLGTLGSALLGPLAGFVTSGISKVVSGIGSLFGGNKTKSAAAAPSVPATSTAPTIAPTHDGPMNGTIVKAPPAPVPMSAPAVPVAGPPVQIPTKLPFDSYPMGQNPSPMGQPMQRPVPVNIAPSAPSTMSWRKYYANNPDFNPTYNYGTKPIIKHNDGYVVGDAAPGMTFWEPGAAAAHGGVAGAAAAGLLSSLLAIANQLEQGNFSPNAENWIQALQSIMEQMNGRSVGLVAPKTVTGDALSTVKMEDVIGLLNTLKNQKGVGGAPMSWHNAMMGSILPGFMGAMGGGGPGVPGSGSGLNFAKNLGRWMRQAGVTVFQPELYPEPSGGGSIFDENAPSSKRRKDEPGSLAPAGERLLPTQSTCGYIVGDAPPAVMGPKEEGAAYGLAQVDVLVSHCAAAVLLEQKWLQPIPLSSLRDNKMAQRSAALYLSPTQGVYSNQSISSMVSFQGDSLGVPTFWFLFCSNTFFDAHGVPLPHKDGFVVGTLLIQNLLNDHTYHNMSGAGAPPNWHPVPTVPEDDHINEDNVLFQPAFITAAPVFEVNLIELPDAPVIMLTPYAQNIAAFGIENNPVEFSRSLKINTFKGNLELMAHWIPEVMLRVERRVGYAWSTELFKMLSYREAMYALQGQGIESKINGLFVEIEHSIINPNEPKLIGYPKEDVIIGHPYQKTSGSFDITDQQAFPLHINAMSGQNGHVRLFCGHPTYAAVCTLTDWIACKTQLNIQGRPLNISPRMWHPDWNQNRAGVNGFDGYAVVPVTLNELCAGTPAIMRALSKLEFPYLWFAKEGRYHVLAGQDRNGAPTIKNLDENWHEWAASFSRNGNNEPPYFNVENQADMEGNFDGTVGFLPWSLTTHIPGPYHVLFVVVDSQDLTGIVNIPIGGAIPPGTRNITIDPRNHSPIFPNARCCNIAPLIVDLIMYDDGQKFKDMFSQYYKVWEQSYGNQSDFSSAMRMLAESATVFDIPPYISRRGANQTDSVKNNLVYTNPWCAPASGINTTNLPVPDGKLSTSSVPPMFAANFAQGTREVLSSLEYVYASTSRMSGVQPNLFLLTQTERGWASPHIGPEMTPQTYHDCSRSYKYTMAWLDPDVDLLVYSGYATLLENLQPYMMDEVNRWVLAIRCESAVLARGLDVAWQNDSMTIFTRNNWMHSAQMHYPLYNVAVMGGEPADFVNMMLRGNTYRSSSRVVLRCGIQMPTIDLHQDALFGNYNPQLFVGTNWGDAALFTPIARVNWAWIEQFVSGWLPNTPTLSFQGLPIEPRIHQFPGAPQAYAYDSFEIRGMDHTQRLVISMLSFTAIGMNINSGPEWTLMLDREQQRFSDLYLPVMTPTFVEAVYGGMIINDVTTLIYAAKVNTVPPMGMILPDRMDARGGASIRYMVQGQRDVFFGGSHTTALPVVLFSVSPQSAFTLPMVGVADDVSHFS
jgi:hypothetical protein